MSIRPLEVSRTLWADSRAALRIVLFAAGLGALLWLIYALSTVILLVVFSVLFAYLIAPLVKLTRRALAFGRGRRLPAVAGITIVYVVIFAGVGAGLTWLVPHVTEQASEFGKAAPAYVQSLNAGSRAFSRVFRRLQAPELGATILARASAAADATGQQIVSSFVHAATYVPWLILIPIVSFFLLKDGEAIKRDAVGLVPERWRAGGERFLERVDRSLAAVIRAQLLACLIVGTLSGVGLALMRVPYAATLGVAAGICESVPLLGPALVGLGAALIAGLHKPMLGLWVVVFLGVLRVVEDYVIYPRLVGHNVHLHPLSVILAVLAGAELGGVVGVLLAVPVLAIVAAAFETFRQD